MLNAYKKFIKNSFKIKGKATRCDYWLSYMANLLIIGFLIILFGLFIIIENELLISIFTFTTLGYLAFLMIPTTTILIRRCHDINKSGWYLLLTLIPYIGFIFGCIIIFKKSVIEQNKY